MSDAWARCLSELAASLAASRAALAAGRPQDVRLFEPPAGLGPLPAALAARARELAVENDLLAAELAALLTASRRQVQLLTVLRHREASVAAFLDARG